MIRRTSRIVAVALLAWGACCGGQIESACGAEGPEPLPSFERVREVTLRHFTLLPDYRPGDIIAQSEVEPLFAQLRWIGWMVADRKRILRDVPADRDYLGRALRTPEGRELMHRIAGRAGAYDRLDRLSRLPHGRRVVLGLIQQTAGQQIVEYVTTGRQGRELEESLSQIPKGTDLSRPTGRLYTAEMLLARLEESYAAARGGGIGD
jgi:hypothetical protein